MHLDRQAKLLVQGLGCDEKVYAVALKWLKKRFGHPVVVAQAVIEKVTKGDKIPFGNRFALCQFHNELRNCIFTLDRMNFLSDLFSSDNLRMAITQLPPGLHHSHAKTSQTIRQQEIPNLIHFEAWMNMEVETACDPDLPVDDKPTRKLDRKNPDRPSTRMLTTSSRDEEQTHLPVVSPRVKSTCPLCPLKHHLSRCWKYQNKSAPEKFVVVSTKGLCFNCIRSGHQAEKCSSNFVCLVTGCQHSNII